MVLKLSQVIVAIAISLTIGMIVVLLRKGNWSILMPIVFGLITSMAFGAIDSLFFLLFEKELDILLEENKIPKQLVPLIVGAISSSISVLIASYLEHYIDKSFVITKSPFLDVFGIILGTAIITLGYVAYLGYKKDEEVPKTAKFLVQKDPVLLA